MFLTMACMSATLTWTHFQHKRQLMAYVAAEASRLLSISQLTQAKVPPRADLNEALQDYKKEMENVGFHVVVAKTTGEVVASTTPGQVGKKIRIKRRRETKPNEIQISAEVQDIDVDSAVEQKTYRVQFPIIQGEKEKKVIGYAEVQMKADEVEALLRRWYTQRLYSILATMLAGFFAVVYLAFRFTKPIDSLVAGAHQVAQGNLSVSLPVTGADEMGRLAQTFNQMVERLRQNRELQERLNEAETSSLLGRFAATVAHEVRNSLNFINLSIDQIRARHGAGEDHGARDLPRTLANIKDEINRLNRLVNDFLAAGRQAPLELASCNLRAAIDQAVALVEKQAHRQDIAIRVDFNEEFPTLQADPSQLKTCFLNILTNAIQAMPHGGCLRISARSAPESGSVGALQVRFADTGPGISPQDREKVFAPYYSTKATGFGLGLAITKKIVEDHGGRIYVGDSEAPGTVIVVELPLPRTPVSRTVLTVTSPAA